MMEGRPASTVLNPSGSPPASGQPPPSPSPSAAAKQAAEPPHRTGAWLLRLAILVIAGGIVALLATRWDVWVGRSSRQTTDDAYVRGDITPLSAQIEGYVNRVAVGDFQLVKAGDPLIEIDDRDYQAQVAQAEANELSAEAAIQNLKARKALQHAEINQAESTIAATQADVDRTQLELKRQRTLLATTYGTAQKVEQAVADEKRFEANLARNRAELEGQRQQM